MTDTELRRLAESCGSLEKWWTDWELVSRDIDVDEARYIAAASPDVVIGLLDRCERAEAELRNVEHNFGVISSMLEARISELECERSDLMRGAANALEKALRAHAAKGGE